MSASVAVVTEPACMTFSLTKPEGKDGRMVEGVG
jgi:hypothetical protein